MCSKMNMVNFKDEYGEFQLEDEMPDDKPYGSKLKVVFCDGDLINETSLAEIRARLW